MKKIILSALFAMGLSNSAYAAVQTLDCSLNSWEEQGWIPDRIIFSIDAGTKQAMVFDGYINEIEGKPKKAKFKTIRGGKYRLMWKLTLPTSDGGSSRVGYTATYNPATTAFHVKVNFLMENVENKPSGDGSCETVKGESLF